MIYCCLLHPIPSAEASMPFIEAKEAKTALLASSARMPQPLIRGLTRRWWRALRKHGE